jgi:hypothetical protein
MGGRGLRSEQSRGLQPRDSEVLRRGRDKAISSSPSFRANRFGVGVLRGMEWSGSAGSSRSEESGDPADSDGGF